MSLEQLPRIHLANLPTPIDELPRLTAALGGPRILAKRDDLTGLAFGGNKTRKLDYLMADAQSKGADVVITSGGGQSNHARQTAAAAAKLGMRSVLVLSGPPDQSVQGNLLLDKLLGAEVRFVEVVDIFSFDRAAEAVAAELRSKGHNPYIIPVGGSNVIGAAAYVAAVGEAVEQLSRMGEAVSHIFLASGSAGTQAGTVLGVCHLNVGWEVIGVSVSAPRQQLEAKVLHLANQTAEFLGFDCRVAAEQTKVDDGYIGPGYAQLTTGGVEAIRLVAQTEGIILDPVYTGKAMAGLIDYIRRGVIGRDQTVLFLHTGGGPGLFAFAQGLAQA